MTRITPFLWFATEAEEAARFYVSVFPNSSVNSVTRVKRAGVLKESLSKRGGDAAVHVEDVAIDEV